MASPGTRERGLGVVLKFSSGPSLRAVIEMCLCASAPLWEVILPFSSRPGQRAAHGSRERAPVLLKEDISAFFSLGQVQRLPMGLDYMSRCCRRRPYRRRSSVGRLKRVSLGPVNMFRCCGTGSPLYSPVAPVHGCPWDEGICFWATGRGHLSILQWIRSNGCPMRTHILVLRRGVISTFFGGLAPTGFHGPLTLVRLHHNVVCWALSNGCPRALSCYLLFITVRVRFRSARLTR